MTDGDVVCAPAFDLEVTQLAMHAFGTLSCIVLLITLFVDWRAPVKPLNLERNVLNVGLTIDLSLFVVACLLSMISFFVGAVFVGDQDLDYFGGSSTNRDVAIALRAVGGIHIVLYCATVACVFFLFTQDFKESWWLVLWRAVLTITSAVLIAIVAQELRTPNPSSLYCILEYRNKLVPTTATGVTTATTATTATTTLASMATTISADVANSTTTLVASPMIMQQHSLLATVWSFVVAMVRAIATDPSALTWSAITIVLTLFAHTRSIVALWVTHFNKTAGQWTKEVAWLVLPLVVTVVVTCVLGFVDCDSLDKAGITEIVLGAIGVLGSLAAFALSLLANGASCVNITAGHKLIAATQGESDWLATLIIFGIADVVAAILSGIIAVTFASVNVLATAGASIVCAYTILEVVQLAIMRNLVGKVEGKSNTRVVVADGVLAVLTAVDCGLVATSMYRLAASFTLDAAWAPAAAEWAAAMLAMASFARVFAVLMWLARSSWVLPTPATTYSNIGSN